MVVSVSVVDCVGTVWEPSKQNDGTQENLTPAELIFKRA